MTGDEHGGVAHGPQALDDAGNERVLVALREIGAANGPGKQHITHKSTSNFRRMKHHVTGRVAGAVTHLQRAVTHRDRITVKQPARGCKRIRMGKAERPALLGQAIDPELIRRMRANDGQRELARQLGRAARMVNVGMGLPDLRECQPPAPDFREQHVEIPTGVDDGGLQGLIAPDNGAVLLEGGNRDGVVTQHAYDSFGL